MKKNFITKIKFVSYYGLGEYVENAWFRIFEGAKTTINSNVTERFEMYTVIRLISMELVFTYNHNTPSACVSRAA